MNRSYLQFYKVKVDIFCHPICLKKKFIFFQCSNYTKGIAYGLLCPAICRGNSVKIESCIHHGTTYVLVGKHNGDNIVLKKKKPHSLSISMEIFEGLIFIFVR